MWTFQNSTASLVDFNTFSGSFQFNFLNRQYTFKYIFFLLAYVNNDTTVKLADFYSNDAFRQIYLEKYYCNWFTEILIR